MKTKLVVLLPAVALLLSACASKPAYKDQFGNRSQNPNYLYGAAEGDAGASAPYLSASGSVAGPAATQPEWPRVFVNENTTNTVYQTQVDAWDGSSLTGRNAVAVQTAGEPQPVYGVITFRATTMVNKSEGAVSLLNLQVQNADFPSAPEKTEAFLRPLREQYPRQVQVLSLESLEASVAANQELVKAASEPLNNAPPRIIVSEKPATLVTIDGDPVLRPVSGTELQRVINTRTLLLKDKEARFYLRLPEGYVTSTTLEGPWQPGTPPPGAAVAEKQVDEAQLANQGAQPETRNQPAAAPADATPPDVYVATKPAELLVFAGPPDYVPVPGTQLLYVTNTTGNVFKLLSDQKTYALLSGRWFCATSLSGPWEFVAASKLPGDFAKIPDNSPKENVKASVPGTPQAREAFIANSIPQTTAVQRTSQMQDPQIDGPPQLAPISGTPLHYVVNSGTPIIKVDDHSWYACQNGVWYVATSVNGPWAVADSVPAVIYSIPISSPMHYVTYVRVYNASDSVVYQGYTPGYMGTVVDSDGVVVYGTGYYYSPWVGSVWYGGPVTWGVGCGPYWSPWTGWSFGFGFGWYWGYPYYYWGYPYYPYYPYYHHHYWATYPPYPCWGPYRYYSAHYVHGRYPAAGPDGWAHTSANVYRRPTRIEPSRPVTASRGAPVYARAYNSRTGTAVAGERAEVQNVFRTPPRGVTSPRMGIPATAGRVDSTYVGQDGRVYMRTPSGRMPVDGVPGRMQPGASRAPVQTAVPGPGTDRGARWDRSDRGDRGDRGDRSGRDVPAFAPDNSPGPRSAPPSSGADRGGGRRDR